MADEEIELVLRISERVRSTFENPEGQPKCDQMQIEQLCASASERLGSVLPQEFLAMLTVIDGFHDNGLFVLASQTRDAGFATAVDIQGVVDDNLEYWMLLEQGLVVLAYNEAELFYCSRNGKEFGKAWRAGDSSTRSYAQFSELLADAADSANLPVRDLMPTSFKFSRYWD